MAQVLLSVGAQALIFKLTRFARRPGWYFFATARWSNQALKLTRTLATLYALSVVKSFVLPKGENYARAVLTRNMPAHSNFH